MVNILVTGAGALVGHGVLRLLRTMARPVGIVTADPDHRAAGHWLGDRARTIPMARDPGFIAAIERIVERDDIGIVLVGTDVELAVFAREKARLARLGANVVVSSPEVIEIADDKWRTVEFLRNAGLPYPRSALASDRAGCLALAAECAFPLFAKPRRGARSVGARAIPHAAALDAVIGPASDLIVQEHLPEHPGEFTAGCVGWGGDVGGVVVLRRDLRDGNTYRAYHDGSDRHEAAIADVARRLGIEGPCNFQFRERDGRPVVFEINARFSGTTPLRALFGFNEVEAIIEHVLTGAPTPRPTLRAGAVLRAWSDIFVEDDSLRSFASKGELDAPSAEAMPFVTRRGRE
jgi:carbamoyl-phosphate synthase large subunit